MVGVEPASITIAVLSGQEASAQVRLLCIMIFLLQLINGYPRDSSRRSKESTDGPEAARESRPREVPRTHDRLPPDGVAIKGH